ncbi:hypothetical protein DERP_006692 [Dermatophagoides pteronyssinus]|uniref:Uncharacterized protein n=1 Tax=Dermatophagoides pteronyssinus TaxID=6956 RepID=A0ABQ8IRN8_DERPT|nr:hypothetical protein DERP_006692 [Dermatophagoides pteronyssinus]
MKASFRLFAYKYHLEMPCMEMNISLNVGHNQVNNNGRKAIIEGATKYSHQILNNDDVLCLQNEQ